MSLDQNAEDTSDNLEKSEADKAIITAAADIARGVQMSLGKICETAVHDFSDLNKSVVALEGNLSDRHLGSPITPLSLEILDEDKDTSLIPDRLLRTEDARLIKSTVIALKNEDGRKIGSFCLNLDVTNLRHSLNALEQLAGMKEEAKAYTFPDDLPQLVKSIMDQEEQNIGRPLKGLDAKSRLSIIGSLSKHQIFEMRNSANLVAEHLGVSRATVYNDLEKVRKNKSG